MSLALWSPILFTYLNINRCWHGDFSSCRTEVKAPSKPQELTQCVHQSFSISVVHVTRLRFLLRSLELQLHLQQVTIALWMESSVWEERAQDSVFNKCRALLICCPEQKPEENTTSMFLLQQISLPGKTFLHFFCMRVLIVAISTLSIPKIISCGKDLISFNSNNNFSNSRHFLPMCLHFGIETNYMF